MSGVNKIILIGNLGRDPELRYTQSGQAVLNFSLATTERWKDKDGYQQERTEWHKIVVWGKQAEICGNLLSKGKQVYVEGRLQSRQWKDKEGGEHRSCEIVAGQVMLLGSRDDGTETAKNQDPGFGVDDDGDPGY